MLNNVHLKNLALIREAEIDFEKGLNIMTGETGSGKSIIIGSINIALGDKANKGLIRNGAEYGLVELVFSNVSEKVTGVLKELDISDDDGSVIITRKITADSTVSKINGQNVTLANLKKVTSLLIDIHGQHDHQSLLNPAAHMGIVDDFGQDSIKACKEEVKNLYDDYKRLRNLASDYNMDEQALEREKSLLEFEKNEIEEAALTEGEDDALENEFRKLEKWQNMSESIQNALILFNDEGNGCSQKLSKALSEVNYALTIEKENSGDKIKEDEALVSLRDTLADMESVAKDFAHDLTKYAASHNFDSARFSVVKDRLNAINHLKSKYGSKVSDILKYYDSICRKLEQYNTYSASRNEINAKMLKLRAELNKACERLSFQRKKTAQFLSEMIKNNLLDLNFLNVDFDIKFEKNARITADGYDKAEFMISLNPGEKPKPLAKIASGGELSRIMLAIKSSIAQKDAIPTMIFDEIDTGISGMTAQKVAQKLKSLGKSHQIICITHLPQIAAMADVHFNINKSVEDGNTISGIRKLDEESAVNEIARLLSGETITNTTLENARELINTAKNF